MPALAIFMFPVWGMAIPSDLPTCTEVQSPFAERAGRRAYRPFHRRVFSTFGAYRKSYVKGHKHAGIDIRGRYGELVYPICAGRVTDIHLAFPHLTLVIEHRMTNGRRLYSSYKHIEDLKVEVGDIVSTDRPVARLFEADEHRRSRFRVNHLHFEMRHDISDEGSASWSAMTMKQLKRYALDPLAFMKAHLEGA